ncbi:ubiquinol-cytochrome C chaperone family protein [Methylobacterium sp. NEAU 140]|uniref:ubiquinol-cytochrome C chaperone family protein n=1 Tax=Methylobacterium sp. NEAU 140 TaxID=3064945 RepID=UPI002733316C|nr:ubiquinol-cytochrome C chaperone family protein [Methylobacterium sp. NEAU 140]MDP4023624.1 ubiquinol-cytochrome C chaperone family protein [Methylobacterium sp. NEAU 140]
MIAGLFRRGGDRRRIVAALHAAVSASARRPGLYTGLGVPDTVEGRFEALCLHAILLLRRLDRLPPPAADIAQDLVDSVFAQLDASLRELGVGDLGVGKRMKKLGAAFYGRAAGYDAALAAADDAALAAALARNVLGGAPDGDAAALAAYVRAADAALAGADLDALLARGDGGDGGEQGLPLPEPDAFARTSIAPGEPA